MMLLVSRRDILAGFGSSLLFWPQFGKLAEAAASYKDLFASAYMDHSGRYGVAILNETGEIVWSHPLPNRGHGMASGRERSWLVTFARRPGNFALAIDIRKRKSPRLFKTPKDTHFAGHGVFSADSRLLFAAENAFEREMGVIGIYDVTGEFYRLGEIPSYGIGPHEIILMPDGKTLCVANGGILTHPDTGRAKLNLDTMKSNIAFINTEDGQAVEIHEMPPNWQKLSLRHMAVDGTQKVWLGGQYQGNQMEIAPLIAHAELGGSLRFVDIPEQNQMVFRNYVGSVATNRNGSQIAFTFPKGNSAVILNAADGRILSSIEQQKVCGVNAKNDDFITSTENGDFDNSRHPVYWDNHIAKISARLNM